MAMVVMCVDCIRVDYLPDEDVGMVHVNQQTVRKVTSQVHAFFQQKDCSEDRCLTSFTMPGLSPYGVHCVTLEVGQGGTDCCCIVHWVHPLSGWQSTLINTHDDHCHDNLMICIQPAHRNIGPTCLYSQTSVVLLYKCMSLSLPIIKWQEKGYIHNYDMSLAFSSCVQFS